MMRKCGMRRVLPSRTPNAGIKAALACQSVLTNLRVFCQHLLRNLSLMTAKRTLHCRSDFNRGVVMRIRIGGTSFERDRKDIEQ
jgi:hypothetical protein